MKKCYIEKRKRVKRRKANLIGRRRDRSDGKTRKKT